MYPVRRPAASALAQTSTCSARLHRPARKRPATARNLSGASVTKKRCCRRRARRRRRTARAPPRRWPRRCRRARRRAAPRRWPPRAAGSACSRARACRRPPSRQRREVAAHHAAHDLVAGIGPALLGERDEERAGPRDHLGARALAPDRRLVRAARDRPLRADDADAPGARWRAPPPRAPGLDHAEHRHGELGAERRAAPPPRRCCRRPRAGRCRGARGSARCGASTG